MQTRSRSALTLLALALLATPVEAFQGAPAMSRFRAHDIDDIRGGYAVMVADFNGDGRLDVLANSLGVPELAWHENPTWEKHVVATGTNAIINQAASDLDGDGIPEIAFQSGFAMQAVNSEGINWIAEADGDGTGDWEVAEIDRFATSHRLRFGDLDGDGRDELVQAPLVGPMSVAPGFLQDRASVFWYDADTWTRHVVTDDVPGIIHGLRVLSHDAGLRQQVLIASFEGLALYTPQGSGNSMTFTKRLISPGHEGETPRLGASDADMGTTNGDHIFAAVEPWHGNEVVVYTPDGDDWRRRVLFDEVSRGHEIEVADLNGDNRADIIVNDNGRPTQNNPDLTPGVHVFFSPENPATGEWGYSRVESEFAMNSCVAGDIDGDGLMDFVCTGAGGKIRWYENLGTGVTEQE